MEFIQKTILRYEGVILCDVPGRMRNDLLKFCFAKNIRTYVAPKISDIILRGAEEIRLFDTPLLLCRNYGFTLDQKIVKRTFDLILQLLYPFWHCRLLAWLPLLLNWMMVGRFFTSSAD